jgi:hypothetical protein
MTKSILGAHRLLIASCILIYGCSKSQSDSGLQQSGISGHLPIATFTLDPGKSPFYGDSVLYVQGDEVSAYIFKPLNKLGAGTYVSWPAGLSIDQQTGVINVSKSEPGSLYNVGFVNAFTGDTAYRQITLPGVAYADGIYYVNGADSVLQPFYYAGNASPGAVNPSGGNNGFAGIHGVFDVPGLSGLRANDQGLTVNEATGAINLKNSLQQGLFGANPQNGDMRLIDIYYRVNDNSSMSLQRTAVIVHYYNTIGDVPTALMNLCRSGQNQKAVSGGSTTAQSGTISGGIIINTNGAPTTPATTGQVARPPHIVLVNKGH